MKKVTGKEFEALFPDRRVPDQAPVNHIWKCPECGVEGMKISNLNCGHHAADLYRKGD
jgi:hypothetical protein